MGIRGEPATPADPRKGHVWQAIVNQINHPGSESEWVSVAETPRTVLARFPWSLSGGGAGDVKMRIEECAELRLRHVVESVGITSFTLEDDLYLLPQHSARRRGLPSKRLRVMAVGDGLRDWHEAEFDAAVFPYDGDFQPIDVEGEPFLMRYMWPARHVLANNILFGGKTKVEGGLRWSEYGRLTASKLHTHLSIAFAFVATHNHFVLDRGGKVFNRSAPVIKLPEGASEDDHLKLLGVLNSSTACFWLKQVSYPKGGDPLGDEGARVSAEAWSDRYEFTGTKVEEFPLPPAYPLELAREIDKLAQQLATTTPAAVAASGVPTRERLAAARDGWHSIRARMVALQEELDWQVYQLYGLLDKELTVPVDEVPELKLGERAFEIVLARKMAAGEVETGWFARHGSRPITQLPTHWPERYRSIVEHRIAAIETNRNIALIERPECKRRWSTDGWDAMQERALRDWLLDRCEARELWYHHVDGIAQPRPLTTAQLADELLRDPDVLTVANIYAPGEDLDAVIAELVADEHVPYLAALRYTESGLAKRADWEQVWELQRQEDALLDEEARREFRKTIPIPPKYSSGDFLKPSYWRHRGKLDVPKERFISYPGASRDGDPSLLIGWAGWDCREQAQALATLIVDREREDGWGRDGLLPLVGGLREILPWVRQWHSEFDPVWGASPADIYAGFFADVTNRGLGT
jgi:hypothetical protein